MAAYPNPFNPVTTIYYELPAAQHVRMQIYDVTGRLVRTLVDEAIAAGPHTVVWQGRDDHGARVASGVYFVAYRTQEKTLREKLTLVK
jgi:flagellar hook assembly protein FlgD